MQSVAAFEIVRSDVLAGDEAFPALPRMKATVLKDRQRFFVLPGLVVQRNEFDCEIVALFDQGAVFLQFQKALLRICAGTLAELI